MCSKFVSQYLPGVLLLRLIWALSPSYIHPDEYFQSEEVTTKLVLGIETNIPWEFGDRNALRSILPPFVSTGLPIYAGNKLGVSRTFLYFFPRVALAAISCSVDAVAFCIYSKYNGQKKSPITPFFGGIGLALSTSWPLLIFSHRPFSNTLEALCLIYSLGAYFLIEDGKWRRFTLGGLFSVGIFTRFTFIAFFLPVGMSVLLDALVEAMVQYRVAVNSNSPSVSSVNIFLRAVCECVFGSVSVALAFLIADYCYYRRLVFTPYNNLMYNSQTENLKLHGIHPRFLHCSLNLPLLTGPLSYFLYKDIFCFLYKSWKTCLLLFWGKPAGKIVMQLNVYVRSQVRQWMQSANNDVDFKVGSVQCLPVLCCISGLAVLSIAPHQEARFLLPLVFPICLVYGNKLSLGQTNIPKVKTRSYGITRCSGCSLTFIAWAAFNTLAIIFFGVIHEAGVIRSLMYGQTVRPDTMIYYHTLMPPRFLLYNDNSSSMFVKIIDLKSSSFQVLEKKLKTEIGESKETWVVAPGSIGLVSRLVNSGFNVREKKQIWPHLSTNDLPSSWRELTLNIYSLK